MNIIFLGPPGSGKGSQAQKLSKSGDFVHFSTGDMLREEIEAKSKFGNQISDLIDKGLFVPDELMVSLLKERLLKVNENQNIIFDGFPRNLDQIPILENMLSEQNQKIDFVLYFNAPKEILEEASVISVTHMSFQ
jgi:adenylate kinase